MSSSEEPNAVSSPTGSLPPPPVPVILPANDGLVQMNGDDVVWHHGKFGRNGFGFFSHGRLGVSDLTVTLSGRLFSPKISYIFLLLSACMVGVGNVPMRMSTRHLPLGIQYIVMILFTLTIYLLMLGLERIIRKCHSPSTTIALNRFKLLHVRHKGNRLIFRRKTREENRSCAASCCLPCRKPKLSPPN
ncbi:MAG: hypothetical protein ACYDCO_07900 [Armatimonadota bacterium]